MRTIGLSVTFPLLSFFLPHRHPLISSLRGLEFRATSSDHQEAASFARCGLFPFGVELGKGGHRIAPQKGFLRPYKKAAEGR